MKDFAGGIIRYHIFSGGFQAINFHSAASVCIREFRRSAWFGESKVWNSSRKKNCFFSLIQSRSLGHSKSGCFSAARSRCFTSALS